MISRKLGALLLPMALVTTVAVTAWGAETKIQPDDTAFAFFEITLMSGSKPVLKLPSLNEMAVVSVKGDWIGVAVDRPGKVITGWVRAKKLSRIHEVRLKTGNEWTLPEVPPVDEMFKKFVPLLPPASKEELPLPLNQWLKKRHGWGGTLVFPDKGVPLPKGAFSIKLLDGVLSVSTVIPDQLGKPQLDTKGKIRVLRTMDTQHRAIEEPVLDGKVWTPRVESIGDIDLASEEPISKDPTFDFREFKRCPGVIPFVNGYGVNLRGAEIHGGAIRRPGPRESYRTDDGRDLPGRLIEFDIDTGAPFSAVLREILLQSGEQSGVEVEVHGKRHSRRTDVDPATSETMTRREDSQEGPDSVLKPSRAALKGSDDQLRAAPYVAFSLKVAGERVTQEPADVYSKAPEVWRLGGINKVRGFVYDRDNDDVILVGAIEPGRAPLTLDDLVVALRARLLWAEWPLVDVEDTDLRAGTERPGSELHQMRYKGGIQNTRFGYDCLAAYSLLMQLAEGTVVPPVAGFTSYRELVEERRAVTPEESVACRFWFSSINPSLALREDTCAILAMKVGVFAEVLEARIHSEIVDDLMGFNHPPSRTFAKQATEDFEELCAAYYCFSRLRGLQELVAVCHGLERMEPTPDLSFWLKNWRIQHFQTPVKVNLLAWKSDVREAPREAPALTLTCPNAKILPTCVASAALAIRVKTRDIMALKEAILTTRPSPDALCWLLKLDASTAQVKQEKQAELSE